MLDLNLVIMILSPMITHSSEDSLNRHHHCWFTNVMIIIPIVLIVMMIFMPIVLIVIVIIMPRSSSLSAVQIQEQLRTTFSCDERKWIPSYLHVRIFHHCNVSDTKQAMALKRLACVANKAETAGKQTCKMTIFTQFEKQAHSVISWGGWNWIYNL